MKVFERTVRTKGVTCNIYAQEVGGITIHFNDYHGIDGSMSMLINIRDLPDAINVYRLLGEAIDTIQPGVVNPVPEGDPDEVDAMKIIFEADVRQRADNSWQNN